MREDTAFHTVSMKLQWGGGETQNKAHGKKQNFKTASQISQHSTVFWVYTSGYPP